MSDDNFNFKDIISGKQKIEIVDKLENLRTQLDSNSLKGRFNKKEILNSIDEIIDSIPVELRTARWIVREQDSLINHAKEESEEILIDARKESDKLIENSFVLKEAVVEANSLIKQAEVEAQAYRVKVEDEIDRKFDDIQNKILMLSEYVESEKLKLRQPRIIEKP